MRPATGSTSSSKPRDFRNVDFDDAERLATRRGRRAWPSRRSSTRSRRTCPSDEDESEWNWEALAKLVNTRWGLNLRDRDLKKIGRDELAE